MYYILFYCIIRTNKTISFPCKPGVLKYKFKTLINVHIKMQFISPKIRLRSLFFLQAQTENLSEIIKGLKILQCCNRLRNILLQAVFIYSYCFNLGSSLSVTMMLSDVFIYCILYLKTGLQLKWHKHVHIVLKHLFHIFFLQCVHKYCYYVDNIPSIFPHF